MPTNFKIKERWWDPAMKEVIDGPNRQRINVAIRKQISDIESDMIARQIDGSPIGAKQYKYGTVTDRLFSKFAREVREDKKEINRIEQYAGKDLLLSQIDVTFLRRYEKHEVNRGMAQNTVNLTFKYLRRIVRQAKAEKLIRENPFDEYDIPRYVQSDRTYLVEAEKQKLLKLFKKPLDPSMENTLGFFLFGCYSGLRHSDWGRFDHDKMVDAGFLKIRAKKNQQWVVLPIGPTLQMIIDRIKDFTPPVSNQKCNVMLKAIGTMARIEKPLTTHVARHSFATMCATNKIPKSVTAELMGVNTSTVNVYYHLTGEAIIQQAAILKTL